MALAALTYRLHQIKILWQSRNFFIQINQRGYSVNETDGIEHEESIVWKKIFNELWSDRITKNHIAKELHIPFDEIENLVFGAHAENKTEKGRVNFYVVE